MRLASCVFAVLATALVAGPRPAPARDVAPTLAGEYEASESVVSMVAQVDVSCILRTWKIVGVDVCMNDGKPHVCVIVENAYPCGILEAVRKPLTSHLAETEAFLKVLEPVKPEGVTSSHTTDTSQGSGLQFSEVHVYEFVPSIPLLSAALPIVVPPGKLWSVSYFSELDLFAWRNGAPDMVLDPEMTARKAALPSCSTVPRTDDCAWSWGSLFPRTGFAIHPSEVMAAHLLALRGGRVAANPWGRIGLDRYPYEPRTGHYVQLVRPTKKACSSIGWPVVRSIESGAGSTEGAYLLIHFGIFRECKGCYGPRLAPARVPAP